MMIFDQVPMQTNLESFLDYTMPLVPSHFLSKNETRKVNSLWYPWTREKVDYFVLGDLWCSFGEWSAYGAGVPIRSHDGDNLIQYFVPYLSAIQIFTTSCFSAESDLYSDSCSDDSESEKLSRSDGFFLEEGQFDDHSRFWNPNGKLGNLYFQYFERSSPYGRVPLADQMQSLAQSHPGLLSLRSVDLSPASWMAVAWYPIYHIPTSRTIRDLQTCFLTYHTLSSSFQDVDSDAKVENIQTKRKEGECIALPPFGLATYKMQGDMWMSDGDGQDHEKIVSLLSAADSWLKQLRVQHHDFNHFIGIRHG